MACLCIKNLTCFFLQRSPTSNDHRYESVQYNPKIKGGKNYFFLFFALFFIEVYTSTFPLVFCVVMLMRKNFREILLQCLWRESKSPNQSNFSLEDILNYDLNFFNLFVIFCCRQKWTRDLQLYRSSIAGN